MSVCPLDLAISMGLEPCKRKLVYTHYIAPWLWQNNRYMYILCFQSCYCYTCIYLQTVLTSNLRLTSAPFLKSVVTTSLCPFRDAIKRGVEPLCI